jgi:hypothetical protein
LRVTGMPRVGSCPGSVEPVNVPIGYLLATVVLR